MTPVKTKKIIIEGIVQGVGFRPFVYRIAKKHNLNGFVINKGGCVEVMIQGAPKNITQFIQHLKNEKPELSKIDKIEIEETITTTIYTDFKIKESESQKEMEKGESTIPADVAICEECLKEMMDKNNRRYNYPFTACTNCGARFTVIKQIPYDRDNTSMDKFPLCKKCLEEYKNPMDRRFHAQATCCSECGPTVFLTDKDGNILYTNNNAIEQTVKLLKEGNIFAIKGIGGAHLVCDANNDSAVLELRKRLNRPTQPFAIMAKPEYLKLFANYDNEEINLFKSQKRPIVVFDKNKNYDKYISKFVSDLNTVGAMAQYSGIHHLLFNETEAIAYVMTSANLPGLPMAIENDKIIDSLKNIADYFLLHNRDIINRCDDSVLKKINNRMIFLRRSRGFAPEPIVINNDLINNEDIKNRTILCMGAELNSVASLVKGNKFYLTQYIGNTAKYETYNYLENAINNILKITDTQPKDIDAIVCDLHPSFNSSKLAMELGQKYNIKVHRAQHHEAHCYSLLGDNNIFEPATIIAIDGVGYGTDGIIWGGEVFSYIDGIMERIGHFEEQYQAGGDLAAKQPLRMLISILYKKLEKEELINFIKKYNYFTEKELNIILFQLNKKLNVNNTTSCGRILDSVSAMLSVCHERTYDGEYAIKLECVAENFIKNCSDEEYKRCLEMVKQDIKITKTKDDGKYILNTTDLVHNCYKMLLNGFEKEFIAYYIHLAIADGLSEIAIKNSELHNIKYIGLTGGVSYNKIISEKIRQNVENNGFKFLYHKNVPNGDGGICFGQGVYYLSSNKIR
ncbi:carbamoyltransferase HypF [Methanococcus aeolicus]|uniref:carbamoyltransferase HypF n=1 Tax=Methanococcus aeolicus TaxID=42879 RepID=UPI0021C6C5DA|nr:carbamoyltransferase HypF [Methanococcus aeolicus]UXM85053.1 carbamoyltransferase HypF [Methanococcus aeolicus]